MNRRKFFPLFVVLTVGVLAIGFSVIRSKKGASVSDSRNYPMQQNEGGLGNAENPYSIDYLRKQDYPGSEIVIEQTLTPAPNYSKYVVSYKSEGLKIYALMTVPAGLTPQNGWPVIIFNHGYITPGTYSTVSSYAKYVDVFAKNGFIVFKSDYRGNGNSEGTPTGHFGPGYTTDVLNAIGSVKKYKGANPQKIGVWGHSMGGAITLNALVISKDIKAASIWAGTVGPVAEEFGRWGRGRPNHVDPTGSPGGAGGREGPAQQFGTPEQNPEFWRLIDPLNYLSDIAVPVEIQQGLADQEVNPRVSENLYTKLKALGKLVRYYTYPGDNHNISNNFDTAMDRSVDFFTTYLKNR